MKERNAAELTLWLVIGVICSPTALGFAPLPKSLADGAPQTLSRIVVIVLCIGCYAAVAGMLWRDRIDGEAIQQVALIAVAIGAIAYSLALLAAAESAGNVANSAVAVAFVAGVGCGALARYVQIRGWLRKKV